MRETLTPFMLERLHRRALNKQARKLPQTTWDFDFSSNDYLSFAKNPQLRSSILQEVQNVSHLGATGSRLLTGNMSLAEDVETYMAEYFGFSKALIFPSGFSLNCGFLACIGGEEDSIIIDENAHACWKNGLKLSPSRGYFFRHNDLNQLESRLKKESEKKRQIFVVVESLYSMDGDCPDFPALLDLCHQYEARLIVDEAHAGGSMGSRGRGLVDNFNAQDRVFANVITFGKAYGYHGAVLLGSKALIEYVVNFCHSFIYTTGLSSFSLIAMRESLKCFESDPAPFNKLRKNISLFNHSLGMQWETPIYYFPFKDISKLQEAASSLQSKGFGILPIYSPTVRKGFEGLRVSLHAHNTESEIISCAKELKEFF